MPPLHPSFQGSADRAARRRGNHERPIGNRFSIDRSFVMCICSQSDAVRDRSARFHEPVPCKALLDLEARIESAKPPLYRVSAQLTSKGKRLAHADAKFLPAHPSQKGKSIGSSKG